MSVLARLLPYALAFSSSLCIMILELVASRLVAPHVGALLDGLDERDRHHPRRDLPGQRAGRTAERPGRPAPGGRAALRPRGVPDAGSSGSTPQIGRILPPPDQMNWELRTVLVVLIDFLIPATVLGMVGPVVAKMAVEQARRAGSAIGDVYFWAPSARSPGRSSAASSCSSLRRPPPSRSLVAAALALLAAALMIGTLGRVIALLTAVCSWLGRSPRWSSRSAPGAMTSGSYRINYLGVAGNGWPSSWRSRAWPG